MAIPGIPMSRTHHKHNKLINFNITKLSKNSMNSTEETKHNIVKCFVVTLAYINKVIVTLAYINKVIMTLAYIDKVIV